MTYHPMTKVMGFLGHEFRKKENVVNVESIKKECKPCPKCAVPIYKNKGCDHMYCKKCFTHFSWETGMIFKEDNEMMDQFQLNIEYVYDHYEEVANHILLDYDVFRIIEIMDYSSHTYEFRNYNFDTYSYYRYMYVTNKHNKKTYMNNLFNVYIKDLIRYQLAGIVAKFTNCLKDAIQSYEKYSSNSFNKFDLYNILDNANPIHIDVNPIHIDVNIEEIYENIDFKKHVVIPNLIDSVKTSYTDLIDDFNIILKKLNIKKYPELKCSISKRTGACVIKLKNLKIWNLKEKGDLLSDIYNYDWMYRNANNLDVY